MARSKPEVAKKATKGSSEKKLTLAKAAKTAPKSTSLSQISIRTAPNKVLTRILSSIFLDNICILETISKHTASLRGVLSLSKDDEAIYSRLEIVSLLLVARNDVLK